MSVIGNHNANKWSEELVKEMLCKIEKEVREGGALYLGEALNRVRITRKAWSYWRKLYRMNEEIAYHMQLITSMCESKIVCGAMNRELHAQMSMFLLKFNHYWTDKPGIDKDEDGPKGDMFIRLNEQDMWVVNAGEETEVFKRVGTTSEIARQEKLKQGSPTAPPAFLP